MAQAKERAWRIRLAGALRRLAKPFLYVGLKLVKRANLLDRR